jgi:RNA-directed DNA polymerase
MISYFYWISLWDDLPKYKSLFHSPSECGLPIGNLTSQVFANFYFNDFDYFIKETLHNRHYGRYVDAFVLLHPDRKHLSSLIPIIENYLKTKRKSVQRINSSRTTAYIKQQATRLL